MSNDNPIILQVIYRKQYPGATLKRMVLLWGGQLEKSGKIDCIKSLCDRFKQIAKLKTNSSEIAQTPIGKLEPLFHTILNHARKKISIDELVHITSMYGVEKPQELMKQLIRDGLLLVVDSDPMTTSSFQNLLTQYSYYSSWKKIDEYNIYVIVTPGLEKHIKTFPKLVVHPKLIDEAELDKIHIGDSFFLLDGLERIAAFTRSRKVLFKRDGSIYKNQLPGLQGYIGNRHEPGWLRFLLAIAKNDVRLVLDGFQLIPNPEFSLDTPYQKQIADLFNAYVQLCIYFDDDDYSLQDIYCQHWSYLSSNITQDNAIRARKVLLDALKHVSNEGWISIDWLIDRVLKGSPNLLFNRTESYSRRSDIGDINRAVQREYLRSFYTRTLFQFGLVDVGILKEFELKPYSRPDSDKLKLQYRLKTEYGTCIGHSKKLPAWEPEPTGLAIRYSTLGRHVIFGEPFQEKFSTNGVMVGADFEIIVPIAQVSPTTTQKINQFASSLPITDGDVVKRFKLERDSLMWYLRGGGQVVDVISLLNEISDNPVPENVCRTLEDWSSTFGNVTIYYEALLLEFDGDLHQQRYHKSHPSTKTIGDRFIITVQPPTKKHTYIDYTEPPIRCLTVSRERVLDIDVKQADFIVRNEISPFAVPIEGKTWQFRITKESILESGLKTDNIIELLRSRALTALPPSFELTVRGWKGEISSFLGGDEPHIILPNKTLLQGVLDHPIINDLMIGNVNNILFFKKDDFSKIVEVLSDMDISIKSSSKKISQTKSSITPSTDFSDRKKGAAISLDGMITGDIRQIRPIVEEAIERRYWLDILYITVHTYQSRASRRLCRMKPHRFEKYGNKHIISGVSYENPEDDISIVAQNVMGIRIITGES